MSPIQQRGIHAGVGVGDVGAGFAHRTTYAIPWTYIVHLQLTCLQYLSKGGQLCARGPLAPHHGTSTGTVVGPGQQTSYQ